MRVDTELLPAINVIVQEAEDRLSKLVGTPVKFKLQLSSNELNEAFLQELVCEAFRVTWKDILGTSRTADIKDARHAYWWLSIKYLEKGPNALKRETQMKDHASVIHGRDRIQDLMDRKVDKLYKKLKQIEEEIQRVIHHQTT